MGDRILEVNGEDITHCNHQDAVMALLKPSDEITLRVQHDPLPEGFQVTISSAVVQVSSMQDKIKTMVKKGTDSVHLKKMRSN